MSTERPATYTYQQLAQRIEQVLGDLPSRSALRAAAAKERHTQSTQAKPRLTLGMPPPLPASSRTAPAVFSADHVEEWLSHHPRLEWDRATGQVKASLDHGDDVEQVVALARSDGLSWRTITDLLNQHDGRSRSTAGVHKRFRRVDVGSETGEHIGRSGRSSRRSPDEDRDGCTDNDGRPER